MPVIEVPAGGVEVQDAELEDLSLLFERTSTLNFDLGSAILSTNMDSCEIAQSDVNPLGQAWTLNQWGNALLDWLFQEMGGLTRLHYFLKPPELIGKMVGTVPQFELLNFDRTLAPAIIREVHLTHCYYKQGASPGMAYSTKSRQLFTDSPGGSDLTMMNNPNFLDVAGGGSPLTTTFTGFSELRVNLTVSYHERAETINRLASALRSIGK